MKWQPLVDDDKDQQFLTVAERTAIERYKDGDLIVARHDQPEAWMACAKGAIRIGSSKGFSRECTLTYVEPGAWFGEVSILDGERHTHDAYAHGAVYRDRRFQSHHDPARGTA